MQPILAFAASTALIAGLTTSPARAPHSDPAPDYATAVARIQIRQEEDDSIVVEGARSILMTHGQKTPRVFVLLHGFTDSPKQFQPLGARFFAGGDNVYIPRLPHHAERTGGVRSLGRIRANELAQFGDSTIDIARGLGDSIIVVGLSAGGNVAGSIAQHRSDVVRAVLIAPAIAAGRVSNGLAKGIMMIGSKLPNLTRTAKPDSAHPEFVQGISTKGLGQVLRLGEVIREEAERSSAGAKQIVLLLNQNDHTVNDEASVDLARRWTMGTPLVSVYSFPADLRLPHNVMEINERGGNLELVYPVVEALSLGNKPPETVKYQFIVSDWNKPRQPGG